jgi:hypothetical protein
VTEPLAGSPEGLQAGGFVVLGGLFGRRAGPGAGLPGRVGPSLGRAGPGGADGGYAERPAASGRGLKVGEKLSSLVG